MLCYHCMREKGDANFCPFCGKQNSAPMQPHQISPGTVLGTRYVLGEVLGEGGFGITYIALEKTLGITVAVKEYFPFGYCNRNTTASNTVSVVSEDKMQVYEKGRNRFLQEAKTLAKFQGEPGVVNVIDFIETNNTAYIVMEYLDGITLREYLRQNGKLPPEQAVRMLLPAMRALAKIHGSGVIHRDVSPDNIMMLSDGSLKLMDFGAARDYDGDNRSMSIMLKQGYAPAEQYSRNGEQGPWTDVYGMCATIYRCITGSTPVDSIDRVHQDTLRTPSQCGVMISPSMEQTIMYGLAVHKENRCPDMNTLIDLFEKALRGEQVNVGGPFRNTHSTFDPNQTVAAETYYVPYSQDDPQRGYRSSQGYRPPAPPYQPQPQPVQKRSPAGPIIAGVLAFLAVVAVVITVAVIVSHKNEPEPSTSVVEETKEVQKMPSLIGMSKDEAIDTLSGMNLVAEFKEEESTSQPAGKVFSQVPQSDSEITDDTKITLYIAKEPATQAPPTPKPTEKPVEKPVTPPAASKTTMYCTSDTYLTVHRSPDGGSASLGKLWKGERVTCTDISSGWCYISDGKVQGYASAEYLSADPSDVPGRTGRIYVVSGIDSDPTENYLSLRASANENSTELAKIPAGTEITYMGYYQDNGYVRTDGYHVRWAKVRYNGKEGYVYDLYVTDRED